MKCILWCGRLVLILLEMMKQRRAAGAKEGCEVCLSGNLRKDHIWEWKSHVALRLGSANSPSEPSRVPGSRFGRAVDRRG